MKGKDITKNDTGITLDDMKAIDTIIGGEVSTGHDYKTGEEIDISSVHPDYEKAKAIKTVDSEVIQIVNPITGKKSEITLNRRGTTADMLGAIMLAPDATREQKDALLASYLFERGKESSSFIAELFISKGTLTKETQAFKRQVRFDFESFANMIGILFSDIANDIAKEMKFQTAEEDNSLIVPDDKDLEMYTTIYNIAQRLEKGAALITKQREKITNDRLREKGYGVYITKSGQAFSIFDDEIEEAVRQDKEHD